MKKSEIIKLVKKQKEDTVNELYKVINDLDKEVDLDTSETHDPEDLSFQAETKDMYYRMKIQLDQAIADFDLVNSLEDSENQSITQGAVVETNKAILFVGVSTSSLNHKNKEIIGISTDAPLYQNIQNKVAGDTFKIGNVTHKIITIY